MTYKSRGTTEAAMAEQLNELAMAFMSSRCLHLVADSGVADHIGESAESTAHLARQTGANEDALARMLRLLSRYGIFEECGASFAHSPLSRFLRSDHPQSQRSWIRLLGSEHTGMVFGKLDHALTTGEPAARTLDPPEFFAWFAAHPAAFEIFNAAMTSKSRGDIAAILRAYDFSRFGIIGDIGGGRGHLITAILGATSRDCCCASCCSPKNRDRPIR